MIIMENEEKKARERAMFIAGMAAGIFVSFVIFGVIIQTGVIK